jgi:tetratricopeptide (TPR) repeat protein
MDGSVEPVGMGILHEGDDALHFVLWVCFRRVQMWAGTAGADAAAARDAAATRHADLDAAIAREPRLATALVTLYELRHGSPASAEAVADACTRIREWAGELSLLRTAIHFAEAAAYADPEDPEHARQAGITCRNAMLDSRAAIWFARAFDLGVRAQNDPACIWALIGSGKLMYKLGNLEDAWDLLDTAARRAERTNYRPLAAAAQHELLTVAAEVRSYPLAEHRASEALRLYARSSPRVPYLVHDIAYLFIENQFYSAAVPLLQGLISLLQQPDEQVLVWSNLARAAAGCGRDDVARAGTRRVLDMIDRHQTYVAEAWAHLAQAAWLLRDWDEAQHFARKALITAGERRRSLAYKHGEWVLNGAERHAEPPLQAVPPLKSQVDSLQRYCLARLRSWKPRNYLGRKLNRRSPT